MRILVVSDTHGNYLGLDEAIREQPHAQLIFHLGDGDDDVARVKSKYPEKMFLQVRGNNDWGSDLPDADVFTVEGKRIFFVHGHLHRVKYGDEVLLSVAREQKADIALFGHTHQARAWYDDGLYIMNPGSLRGYHKSYGVIDLTPAGIALNIIQKSDYRVNS